MSKLTIKLILFSVLLFLCASCAAIQKTFPKKPRPYQERSFDSKLWLDGDYQTRGEMMSNLMWGEGIGKNANDLRNKSQAEIVELLGKPDSKTTGTCCGVPRTAEVEVWLYNVEWKPYLSEKIENRSFQVFFSEDGKQVEEVTVGDRDEKHPVHVPRIG